MDGLLPINRLKELQGHLAKLPQCGDMVTTHYFSGGMYCRKVWRPKWTVIIGKVHKAPHFFMCTLGQIAVSSGDGQWKTLSAGDVIESIAGTKRITVALTDAVGMTVHRTEKTDLDEIEKELIEEDELSLFDSSNKLKFDVQKFREVTAQVIEDEIVGYWSDWTKEQQALYTAGKWREFSLSRGYSEEAINKYQEFMDMIADAKSKNINPFLLINDLATKAALDNIALDKKGEIMKSSHLPFESRGSL